MAAASVRQQQRRQIPWGTEPAESAKEVNMADVEAQSSSDSAPGQQPDLVPVLKVQAPAPRHGKHLLKHANNSKAVNLVVAKKGADPEVTVEADIGADPQTAHEHELDTMQNDIAALRQQLSMCRQKQGNDKSLQEMEEELAGLQEMLKKLKEAEAQQLSGPATHDELKVEIQHLRTAIGRLDRPEVVVRMPVKQAAIPDAQVTPCSQDIDIDTEMPYGELEPFGREDTAQELTESSIRESDEMVDQLERAEVAEEKRAVFRALTRLRGAAITSFDGVARSQTGNIDEYNKVHKWRSTHPLRHLADEESDISKWAFPDNAD
jgi:hypothetical protein